MKSSIQLKIAILALAMLLGGPTAPAMEWPVAAGRPDVAARIVPAPLQAIPTASPANELTVAADPAAKRATVPELVRTPPTTAVATSYETAKSAMPGCCAPGGCGCRDALFSEPCPRFGAMLWSGYDSWRGISDGGLQNNNGGSTGINLGAPVPWLDQFGIGAQFGGSAGTYDLMGRTGSESNRVQQQYFATAGLFRRADEVSRISLGVAYDWMINDNFGQFSDEPFLSQWRVQAGYALNARNEIGAFGTWIDRTDSSNGAGVGPLTYRPVSQVDFFWHHKLTCLSADTWFWVGVPNRGSRGGNGTLADLVIGCAATAPIGDRCGAYFNAAYLKPTARAGAAGSAEDGFSLGTGLAFYFGGTARSATVAGRKWMPLMPVANNGTFWVDQF